MNNNDHTDVNDCPQGLCDIYCVNHVSLCEYDVHESDSDFNIDNIESIVEHDQAFIKIKLGLNKKEVKFKIDTGSHVNILPETMI